MPTLKEIIEDKLSRLESVPAALATEVEKYQIKLYSELLTELNVFDVDADGNFKVTSKNFAKLETFSQKLKLTLTDPDSAYAQAVSKFIEEMSVQAAITNAYVAKEFSWKPKAGYKKILQSAQKDAIKLLIDTGLEAKFIEPLKQQLAASISTGASFKETAKAMQTFIQGDEKQGKLLSYVNQDAFNAFAISDRNYSNAIFDAIGAEWYLWEGGLVRDSRDFCKKNNGKYFHRKEIEAMADEEWQGKREGTNKDTIFSFVGGYRCMHALLAVSESSVPEADILRAKEKGYITA